MLFNVNIVCMSDASMYHCVKNIMGIDPEVYVINAIIGVPVYFFFRWALRRHRDPWEKAIAPWILTLFFTPMIYAILIFFLLVGHGQDF